MEFMRFNLSDIKAVFGKACYIEMLVFIKIMPIN
jgi:hypothetical protein